ncbi:MAG: hypothetical protein JJD96_05665 [Thermoleophilia bacterium]|nr:hypothetical protein [Thermoleophilia bacterium]
MNEELEKNGQGSGSRLQAALDGELGRLLDGKAGLEECCAANQELAAELRPLLQLALSGREALQAEVPTAAREKTRGKLVAQARSLSMQRRSSLALLRPLVLAAGLFVLLFAGTAVASSEAGPDSRLYPLKQRLELAHTTLAMQNLDQARAENSHANARLDELQKMLDNNRQEYVSDLLACYDKSISDATAHARSAAADGEDTAEIDALIQSTRLRHEEMLRKISAASVAGEAGPQPVTQDETGANSGSAQPAAVEPIESTDGTGAPVEDAAHAGSESGGDGTPDSGGHDGGSSHDGGSQSSPEREDGNSHNEESSHNESSSH